ncbi:MAG: Arc family DNA-binding protein [Marinicella sp.]
MHSLLLTQAVYIDRMAKKKSFPLRINEEILSAVQQWAADDLRSVNAQIEYVLRESLRKSGRLKKQSK